MHQSFALGCTVLVHLLGEKKLNFRSLTINLKYVVINKLGGGNLEMNENNTRVPFPAILFPIKH